MRSLTSHLVILLASGLPLVGPAASVAGAAEAPPAGGDAPAAYAKESDRVWALFRQRKYGEAEALVGELAAKSEHAAASELVQADVQAAKALKAFWAAVETGLAERVGKTMAVAGAAGILAEVRKGELTLRGEGGLAKRRVDQLATRQALAHAALRNDPQGKLLVGVFLLAEGADFEETAKALGAAGDAPGVAAYKQRLERLWGGAARVAWEPIAAFAKAEMAQARAKQLAAMIQAFDAKFAKSPYAKSIADEAAGLRTLSEGVAKGWVSLFDGKSLQGWNAPKRFPVEAPRGSGDAGPVRVQSGAIVLGPGHPITAIAWTRDFPSVDYEVTFEIQRTTPSSFLCEILFPVAESRAEATLGGWHGVAALQFVDGQMGSGNATTRRFPSARGRWYTVRLRVTRPRIELWVDAEKLIDFGPAGHRIEAFEEWQPVAPFGIGTWESNSLLRGIQLRRIDGRFVEPPKP